jgi:hypothetical protein
MMAVADYGQYGHETETTVAADGQRSDSPVRVTPGGRPVWEPWILERALICRALDWRVTPAELDPLGLELKHAQIALAVFDAFRTYSTDLKQMTEPQSHIVKAIEDMRDAWVKAIA